MGRVEGWQWSVLAGETTDEMQSSGTAEHIGVVATALS